MSVSLTGTGGLYTRLGVIFAGIRDANTYLASGDLSAGGLRSIGVRANNIAAQYASALQYIINGLYGSRDAVRAVLGQWKTDMATLAVNTLIEQVHADATLVTKDIPTAMTEIIRQQIGGGTIYNADNDVDASTVSASVATVTGITNTGNGTVAASVKRTDGRDNEYVFAEVVEVRVSGDANSGSTARGEPATVKGEVAVADPLGFDWPGGSAAATTLTAVDASLNNSGGTVVYGGNFDTFTTTNQADYWGSSPIVGSIGTDILEEATIVYRAGGKSQRFKGDGVTLSSIAQVFGVTSPAVGTSGTSYVLKANTVYAVYYQARKTAGAVAGAVQVRFIDSTNAVILDDAGNTNVVTAAVGSLSSASFTAITGFLITPKTITPTGTYKLNLRVSTAITNNESIYVDDLCVCEATQLYTGGPYAALFAGSTNFLKGDAFNVTIANNYAGDFQSYFDRVFGMKALGLQLPSDTGGAETLSDSLVT